MTTQRESIKSWVESHGGNDAIARFKCGDRSANWLIEKALQALSQPNEPGALLALKNTQLQNRIDILEDLLTSAHNIANRNGIDTHWLRFAGQLHVHGIGCVTAKTFKILPSDDNYTAPTAQPNEPVGKIDATDDGDCGTQYWGELDMAVLHERGFKVGDNLFLSPPNLEAKINELEAHITILQELSDDLSKSIINKSHQIAELTAKVATVREDTFNACIKACEDADGFTPAESWECVNAIRALKGLSK